MSRAVPAVLLCALCIWGSTKLAAAEEGGSGTQGYSCDAINKVPAEQQCSFVRDSCSSESLVPYAEWYYCHVAKAHVLLRWMYVGLVCCLLPLAFCLLGDTAEFYIAPIMAHVSQAIPKMRPRFAGVTFVALGNGAPDLSANIAAISSGEITLSAGALTGAAMFVQCIVAAELVALAGPSGIKCGGAMLRDVGVYCLAIFSVLLAFALGQVSRAFVGWAITLYLVYMIWVFVGDEWHQRGRPRPQRLDIKSIKDMLSGVYQGGGLGSRQNGVAGMGPTASAGAHNAAGELEESLLPWAVAEEEDSVLHEPVGFEQPLHPPASRYSGSSMMMGSGTGSSGLKRASTELSEMASAAVGQRGSVAGADLDLTAGSNPVHLLPQRTYSGTSPQTSYQTATDGIAEQPSWRRGSAASMQQPHLLNLGNQRYIDPKTYKQLVWADLADDQEEEVRLEREIAQQLLAGTRRQQTALTPGGSYQPPGVEPAVSQLVMSVHSQQQQQQQHEQSPRSHAAAAAAAAGDALESGLLLSPFGPGAIRTAPSTPAADGSAVPAGASPAAGAHWDQSLQQQQQGAEDVWQQLQWQVTLGNSEEWADSGPIRQLFRRVTFPVLLPVYLGQRLTIPFASAAGYSREWLMAALLCCPLALVVYLGLLNLPAVLVACGLGVAAAVAAAVLTMWDAPGQMPVQGLGGTTAAVVPGVLAVLAFVMGVVWIDTIATEVVGVLTFVAGLAGLPSGVMGLTLLAWGSSLGDFFGNRAMAKAGHGSTAITACFAAPLFNMLMSLSLGFSTYLHKIGSTAVKVQLTPEVALGCVFLMGYNTAIICIGRLCGQRLPPWFACFARVWYGLYFVLSVFSGFYSNSLTKLS